MKCKLLIVLLLLITGCTRNTSTVNNNEDFLYFLYAAPLADHPIWLKSKEGFEQACKELDIKCDWIGPKVIDTERMEDVMQQGIVQKADGIITQGVVSKDILTKANDANIPVALVDSNVEDAPKFIYYGKNFHTQAELMLQQIEKKIPKEEKMMIAIQVAELNFDIAKDQIKEIETVFQQHPGGYELVSVSESKSDKVRAQSERMTIFREHPEINVTINFAAESAEACGEIAKTLNIKDDIYIFGVDDMETTISYIKEGLIDASIVTSFYEYGYKSVYQIYNYIKTGYIPKPEETKIKLIVVDKQNADTYEEELK